MKSSLIALFSIGFLLFGTENRATDIVLVEAFPPVDSVQASPPPEIRLRFDRPLNDVGSSIQITDETGHAAAINPSAVDPSDQTVIFASLPALVEGIYTIHYQLAALGSSTISVGSYQFAIDLPPPVLSLTRPLSGQSFPEGTAVPLQMETRFFDFSLYNNRVRIYVDGSLQEEIRSLNYSLTGLSPGVHEVKVILVQLEDTELPATTNIIYIAVAHSDSQLTASGAFSASSRRLTLRQTIVAILITLILVASGVWLGRELDISGSKDRSSN